MYLSMGKKSLHNSSEVHVYVNQDLIGWQKYDTSEFVYMFLIGQTLIDSETFLWLCVSDAASVTVFIWMKEADEFNSGKMITIQDSP